MILVGIKTLGKAVFLLSKHLQAGWTSPESIESPIIIASKIAPSPCTWRWHNGHLLTSNNLSWAFEV